MRIRKNAKKLSPLLFSSCAEGGSVPVETHVCQLNQSPWDVIPFDSDSIQFQLDDTFAAPNNNNNGDSLGAVESVASLMDSEHAATIIVDNNSKVANGMANLCKGFEDTNKGLPCKNEVGEGQSFCQYHLSLSNSNGKKQPSSTGTGSRRGKSRGGTGKKTGTAATSNPYEFYYYSGFGPSWGKRRGDRSGEESKSSGNSTIVESDNAVGVVVAGDEAVVDEYKKDNNGGDVEMKNEGIIDYEDDDDDDDDEDEEEEENGGKKRMRKPVKARSLKSLM